MKASELRLQYKMENNPLKYSPLPKTLKLKDTGETVKYIYYERNETGKMLPKTGEKPIFKDQETEEFFIKKDPEEGAEDQNLQVEAFISLLTKGVLHSSDIIKINGEYFSKKIDLTKTEIPNKGELEAELFLLSYLFSDWDKKVPNTNMAMEKSGEFAHFDYGKGFTNMNKTSRKDRLQHIGKYREPQGWGRRIKTAVEMLGIPIRGKNSEAKMELLQKTAQILENLKDDNFYRSILKHSELDIFNKRFNFLNEKPQEEREDELRIILEDKCKSLLKLINENK